MGRCRKLHCQCCNLKLVILTDERVMASVRTLEYKKFGSYSYRVLWTSNVLRNAVITYLLIDYTLLLRNIDSQYVMFHFLLTGS